MSKFKVGDNVVTHDDNLDIGTITNVRSSGTEYEVEWNSCRGCPQWGWYVSELTVVPDPRDARIAELEAKLAESIKKGEELCADLGSAMIELGKHKPKPVVKIRYGNATESSPDNGRTDYYNVVIGDYQDDDDNLKLTFTDGKLTNAEVIK